MQCFAAINEEVNSIRSEYNWASKQYKVGGKKVKSPGDISFHDSLFQSFEIVPELISAFWKRNTKYYQIHFFI